MRRERSRRGAGELLLGRGSRRVHGASSGRGLVMLAWRSLRSGLYRLLLLWILLDSQQYYYFQLT